MEKNQSNRKYRILFAGSPAYAIPSLEALLALPGCTVVGVLTQKPKPRGRGNILQPSAVGAFAESHNLLTLTPHTLRTPESQALLASLHADVGVVVAYGKILPQNILDLLPHGWINAHASLLPRWRGASPIQQAILAGDTETGVSLMRLDAGMDTGPVFAHEHVSIDPHETAQSLAITLAELSGKLLRIHLLDFLLGSIIPHAQPSTGITLAPQLTKADALLQFTEPAQHLERKVRAFNPWPGTTMLLQNVVLKILEAKTIPGQGSPGVILPAATGFSVATPQGLFCPLRVQVPGKKPMQAAEFYRGYRRLFE